MEVIIVNDAAAGGRIVADAVCQLLLRKPSAVLGLASGTSPGPTYDELIARYQQGDVSFGQARAFMLDEYLGLDEDDPNLYINFIKRRFADRVDFAPGSVRGPATRPPEVEVECAAYEARIREAGGVDLQILGIGRTGHIAFNEPSSSLASRTRIKTLTDATRADNARLLTAALLDDGSSPQPIGSSAVPVHVITQGVGTIMEARHLILIANGEHKAPAVAAAVEGPVTAMCPASMLQMHPHATVVVDEPAASKLKLSLYYKTILEMKPSWQPTIS